MSTQLAVRTDIHLKKLALKKAKVQGLSLSFVINRLLKNYIDEDYEVFLKRKKDIEGEVTCDELFFHPEIVAAANKLSDYLHNKKL